MLGPQAFTQRQQPLMSSRGPRQHRDRRRHSRLKLPFLTWLLLAALLVGGTLLALWRLLPEREEASEEEEARDSQRELHLLEHEPSPEFCARAVQPLVCAHGGDTSDAPPNTARAFQAAMDAGVRCVEVDAAMTQDGALVVLHARELAELLEAEDLLPQPPAASWLARRLVGKDPPAPRLPQVGDYTLTQLAALRWEDGEKVELVRDVVERVLPAMDLIILDIKTYTHSGEDINADAMAAAVMSGVVLRTGCRSCLVWAKADAVITAIKELWPAQRAGIIVMNETAAERAAGMHNVYRLPAADAVGVHWAMVDRQLVAGVQARGQQVLAWTANTAGMMRAALDAGVDAVVTNRPQELQHAVNSRMRRCEERRRRNS